MLWIPDFQINHKILPSLKAWLLLLLPRTPPPPLPDGPLRRHKQRLRHRRSHSLPTNQVESSGFILNLNQKRNRDSV